MLKKHKILFDTALNALVDTSVIFETKVFSFGDKENNRKYDWFDTAKSNLNSHADFVRLHKSLHKINAQFLPFIFKLVPRYVSARSFARELESFPDDRNLANWCMILLIREFNLFIGFSKLDEWNEMAEYWENQ